MGFSNPGLPLTGGTLTGPVTSSSSFNATGFTADQSSTGSIYANNGGNLGSVARGYLQFPADGVFTLLNNAGSGFTRLNFGGTTSAFPSIKRNGTALNFRLADDSADAQTTASTVLGTSKTVAQLPAAASNQGAIAFVTDATQTAIAGLGLTVVGGGANKVPVYSDGTNWIII